jgi:hypothetical protein
MDVKERSSGCGNSCSTSQESPRLLWKLNFHFRADKSPAGPDPEPLSNVARTYLYSLTVTQN